MSTGAPSARRRPDWWSLLAVIKAARRRMRRRRLSIVLAMVASGAGLGLLLTHFPGGGDSGGPSSDGGAAAARSAVSPSALLLALRRGDSWSAFQTGVNPGGGVQFVSSRIGFVLSPAAVPRLDENLSAGDGILLAWPSPRVLTTRDGGRSFTSSLSAPAGIWGIDFISSGEGWVVAVNGLYRTRDGGRQWQHAGEPKRPLVRVAFSTALRGFGLTVAGRLEATHDGGDSWQPAAWRGHGAALCTSAPGQAIVAGQSGPVSLAKAQTQSSRHRRSARPRAAAASSRTSGNRSMAGSTGARSWFKRPVPARRRTHHTTESPAFSSEPPPSEPMASAC